MGKEKADGLFVTHLAKQTCPNPSLQSKGQEEATQFEIQNTRKTPAVSEGGDTKGLQWEDCLKVYLKSSQPPNAPFHPSQIDR